MPARRDLSEGERALFLAEAGAGASNIALGDLFGMSPAWAQRRRAGLGLPPSQARPGRPTTPPPPADLAPDETDIGAGTRPCEAGPHDAALRPIVGRARRGPLPDPSRARLLRALWAAVLVEGIKDALRRVGITGSLRYDNVYIDPYAVQWIGSRDFNTVAALAGLDGPALAGRLRPHLADRRTADALLALLRSSEAAQRLRWRNLERAAA